MPRVDKEECVGCGVCVNICPVGAVSLVSGKAEIDGTLCIKCGRCIQVCPHGAIYPDKNYGDMNASYPSGPGLGLGRKAGRGFGNRGGHRRGAGRRWM